MAARRIVRNHEREKRPHHPAELRWIQTALRRPPRCHRFSQARPWNRISLSQSAGIWSGREGFASRSPLLESVFDSHHARLFPVLHINFDNIESPGDVPGSKSLQPGVRAALDELLLFPVHRVQRSDACAFAAGFHLDEKQEGVFPCHDVDLAAAWSAEVFVKNFAVLGPQPLAGDFFAKISDLDAILGISPSISRTVGKVERRAETCDDDGGKAHGGGELQGVPLCHSLGAWQSGIEEIPRPARACGGHG